MNENETKDTLDTTAAPSEEANVAVEPGAQAEGVSEEADSEEDSSEDEAEA